MLTRRQAIPARFIWRGSVLWVCAAAFVATSHHHHSASAAEAPSVERTLNLFRPVQKDVEIETPPPEDFKKCRITVERAGKTSGWIVFGPNGQVLRRFADTNGDNVVDQWRYYNHGLEVYRDIDTNNNAKPDEYRWLNTEGSRWGVDRDEDGRIDSWKSISPQEAVRQAVLAMVRQDEKLLQTVLVTRDDLKAIGVSESYATKISEAVSDAAGKTSQTVANSKVLNKQSVWTRADNLTPCAIPAEEGKLRDDLTVYENAMAIVETQGKTGLVQIGELIPINGVWKLTQIPQPIEGNSVQIMAGGLLMQPSLAAAGAAQTDTPLPSAEVQKVLAELQKLDQASPAPTAGAAKLTEYNAQRADILSRLVAASSTEEERTQWMRQMIDSIASAVQIGAYTEGLARLKSLETEQRAASTKSPIVPYIVYRRLLADYTTQHQGATTAKQQEIQKWWRGELEKFAKEFPGADDAPEALLQLAIAYEFVGQIADAKHWYGDLTGRFPLSKPGRRAAGALRRLDLKGKPFEFSGPTLDGRSINARDYRDRVLLVVYWATWCTSCTEDVPVLQSLYEKYHGKGLEIVGVSLDVNVAPIAPYLEQHKITWSQIYQPGGTESPPATAFGVIVPPVMILVDRQGKVATITTTIDEIKATVPELVVSKIAKP